MTKTQKIITAIFVVVTSVAIYIGKTSYYPMTHFTEVENYTLVSKQIEQSKDSSKVTRYKLTFKHKENDFFLYRYVECKYLPTESCKEVNPQ